MHCVLGFELMTQIAREGADLTSMMCIVLDEIREHVDCGAVFLSLGPDEPQTQCRTGVRDPQSTDVAPAALVEALSFCDRATAVQVAHRPEQRKCHSF